MTKNRRLVNLQRLSFTFSFNLPHPKLLNGFAQFTRLILVKIGDQALLALVALVAAPIN